MRQPAPSFTTTHRPRLSTLTPPESRRTLSGPTNDPGTQAFSVPRRAAERVIFGAPLAGTPSPTRRALSIFAVEAVFSNAYAILVTGSYLTGFALLLGMGDFELGLLVAIPMVANWMALAGAWLAERFGTRKRLVVGAAIVARMLWAPLMLLPFLPMGTMPRIVAFLVIYAVSSLCSGLSTTVLQSWMADLVPVSLRGRFFGRRNLLINLASILAMLAGGLALDFAKAHGYEQLGYLALFALALVCGSAGTRALNRQVEAAPPRRARRGFVHETMRPLRDLMFRRLVVAFGVLHFGLGISAPFFTAYMLKELHVSYAQVGLFSMTSMAVGMLFHPVWGAAIDRAGVKSAMIFNLCCVAVIPLLYLPSITYGIASVWLGWVMVGVCWSGFNIGATNLSFALSPAEGRDYYLAMLNIVQGATFFVGSVLSGWVAEQIEHLRFVFATMEIVHYHVLFTASSVLRFASVLFFALVPDVRNRGVRAVLVEASENLYSKLASIPLAVMTVARIGRPRGRRSGASPRR